MEETMEEASAVEETAAKERTPEETAFLHALDQRRAVAGSLKDGSLACLPGRDGYADTEPAVNIADGARRLGANQLYLKDFQKKNGFPTAEFVTAAAVEKSGIPVRKGQHGVWAELNTRNAQTRAWEQKSVRLFNIAQTASPAKMKAFAENALQERQREKQEYLRQMYGSSYQPKEQGERGEKKPGPEIVCSSAEPEKYLGQYLAAVSMGGKFKASGEQAAEFAQKMGDSLFERTANGHPNPFKLAKICNAAGEHCRSVIRDARMPAPRLEQKQEMKRGRGM
jgi:hypothetical protein